MPKKLTGFERMWNAYPAPGGTAEEAKAMIGGSVNAPWMTNTCVVRVSRSLNYGGHLVPMGFPGLSTVSGRDGLRYAFRVEEFRKYLAYAYGPATLSVDRPQTSEEVPQSFKGQTGVIFAFARRYVHADRALLTCGTATPAAITRISGPRIRSCCGAWMWSGTRSSRPGLSQFRSPGPVGHGGTNKADDVARAGPAGRARVRDRGPPMG
ncbi:MAG: T6SS effector amidase Tae4 family protein [Polyangiaceae bacterium]